MKTKEELNTLKEEIEALNKKLAELTEEELAQVSGGDGIVWIKESSYDQDDTQHTWYGTDNDSNTVFTPGSRFWVRWLTKEEN